MAARLPGPRKVWSGPLPTDPLELALEYKLGFDDVSDLQGELCFLCTDTAERKFNAEDAKVLADAMIAQGPCEVEYIFFQNSKIGDQGLEAVAKAMAAGATPKLLTVDFTNILATDAGFMHLLGAIKHCPNLRDLVFKQNSLTDAAFSALHEVIKRGEWPAMERLNLAGTQSERHTISDASFVPFGHDLADGVIRTTRLEEIELSDTDISDAGLAAVALAIQRGHVRKLRSLYMQACHITDEGARALADALRANKRTQLFDIRLGYQNSHDAMAPRVTAEGGKAAIEAAGESLDRKVFCVLHPLEEHRSREGVGKARSPTDQALMLDLSSEGMCLHRGRVLKK